MIDLGKACDRKLSEAEVVHLREVSSRLNLREDDALQPLLAAMEYQRIYYEALSEKIAGMSRVIIDGTATTAKKETAAAQTRHTDNAVGGVQNLASKIQCDKLVLIRPLALICLLAYGSLVLWAGFRTDTGWNMPLAAVFQMPSGWLTCGLSLVAGVFLRALSGETLLVGRRGRRRITALAAGFIITGVAILTFSLQGNSVEYSAGYVILDEQFEMDAFLSGNKNLCHSVSFHIRFGASEGFESLNGIGIEEFIVQIDCDVLNRVEAVKNLYILIANEQLLRECSFSGIQKRSAVVGVDLGCRRAVGIIDPHGDFEISLNSYDEVPVMI